MPARIAVLGVGISGLACAFFLQKCYGREVELVLLEQSERTGGWIRTIFQDNFLFECGPRSCRSKGAGLDTLSLIEELGLQDQAISACESAEKRYLYFQGKLRALPRNSLSFLLSPLALGMLKSAAKDLWAPAATLKDETIYSFISRRFGRKTAERLIDPLVSGIYAGDIRKLSIRSCFPLLYQAEKEHGSVIKGLFKHKKKSCILSPFVKKMAARPLFSLRGGIQQLTDALSIRLDADLKLSEQVVKLEPFRDGVKIATSDGGSLEADYAICALPACRLADLLPISEAQRLAQDQTYASIAAVNLGYTRPVKRKNGFGYLIPSSEEQEILGVVFDSDIFPQQNSNPNETRLTVMMGGMHRPDIFLWSDDRCLSAALAALEQHMGISARPEAVRINRADKAIPQYFVGHEAWRRGLKDEMARISSRIHLIGSSYESVSVNDCIANAKKFASNLFSPTSKR